MEFFRDEGVCRLFGWFLLLLAGSASDDPHVREEPDTWISPADVRLMAEARERAKQDSKALAQARPRSHSATTTALSATPAAAATQGLCKKFPVNSEDRSRGHNPSGRCP
jgi:hypothetical protein